MGVDDHTFDLGGTPVFYRSGPASQTPPLYLHGAPTSSDDFVELLELTGGFAPDLLGFGRSSKAGNLPFTLDSYGEFVEAFLDHLGIERVQLVAHGTGAGGGLVFAQRYPERIEKLVLIDALPLLPGFRWSRMVRALRTPVLGELLMGATNRRLLARLLSRPADQVAAIWEQFDQGTQRAILRFVRDADEANLARAGEHLARLGAPALIVWGELDPWVPVEFAAQYAERLPGARVQQAPGAGHWPWLDDPAVTQTIADFLA